jgi:hypothetical protein
MSLAHAIGTAQIRKVTTRVMSTQYGAGHCVAAGRLNAAARFAAGTLPNHVGVVAVAATH